MKERELFDTTAYSLEEAEFLSTHLGNAPEVVEMDFPNGLPPGCNPKAIYAAIERIFRLQQQAEHRGLQWVGVEVVKDACRKYVEVFKKWQTDAKRGAPKFPSLYEWDDRGRPTKGAVGADGGVVKTYFDEHGERQEFAVELVPSGLASYVPSWIKPAIGRTAIPKVLEDRDKGTIQCPVCFFTQNFDVNQRSTYNSARGRIAKHLLQARRNPDAHRAVYTQEFPRGDELR